MKLSKIKVNNFKTLDDHEIDFRLITVLAGGNSVGKSSTIQALLLVRSVVDSLRSHNYFSSSGRLSVPLNGPYMLSLGSTIETISWERGKTFGVNLSDGSLDFRFETGTLHNSNFFIDVNYPVLANSKLNFVDKQVFYLAAERLGPRIRHWVNEDPDFLHCGFQGQYTIDVLARLGEDPEFLIQENKFLRGERISGIQTLSKYTQQWMDFIIPGTVVDSAEILGQLRSTSIKFNSFFSAPNVGFGVSYCLPIIVTGLIANPGCTIIVENPEAHLHPKAQSNLGYYLASMASTGIQVIIETHSEHIINGIRLNLIANELGLSKSDDLLINFFLNTREGTRVTKIFMNGRGDLTDFPVDFFDQSQQDLLKMFNLGQRSDG